MWASSALVLPKCETQLTQEAEGQADHLSTHATVLILSVVKPSSQHFYHDLY